MRIIGGEDKGRRLRSPSGKRIRPSSDWVREAIFDVLGNQVVGSRVLDLFAGTGALGLEALSRGAREAVFVDNSPQAVALIKENLNLLEKAERSKVLRCSARRYVSRARGNEPPFDLIFIDPPYRIEMKYLQQLIIDIAEGGMLASEGMMVVEGLRERSIEPFTRDFLLVKRKIYGNTSINFIKLKN